MIYSVIECISTPNQGTLMTQEIAGDNLPLFKIGVINNFGVSVSVIVYECKKNGMQNVGGHCLIVTTAERLTVRVAANHGVSAEELACFWRRVEPEVLTRLYPEEYDLASRCITDSTGTAGETYIPCVYILVASRAAWESGDIANPCDDARAKPYRKNSD